jgi:hypothetical protein
VPENGQAVAARPEPEIDKRGAYQRWDQASKLPTGGQDEQADQEQEGSQDDADNSPFFHGSILSFRYLARSLQAAFISA